MQLAFSHHNTKEEAEVVMKAVRYGLGVHATMELNTSFTTNVWTVFMEEKYFYAVKDCRNEGAKQ